MTVSNKDWLGGTHYIFNHDMCSMVLLLDGTSKTEEDAARILVQPFAETAIDVLDVCILSTATHLARTRHNRIVTSPQMPEYLKCLMDIGRHYADSSLDLLDIIVKHGHACGKKVLASLRLNHNVPGNTLADIPGRMFTQGNNIRKDFRDEAFHAYLIEVIEDLLDKNVDGISLDFVRKSPFFPDEVSQKDRFDACRSFLQGVRALSDKPLVVRVSHNRADGEPDGQDPERWLRDGLVDVVVPSIHNHNPDHLDWPIERFVSAAKTAPAPAYVWPQIWPTFSAWQERTENMHTPDAVQRRIKSLREAGADGIYFFNFCCGVSNEDEINKTGNMILPDFLPLFRQMNPV